MSNENPVLQPEAYGHCFCLKHSHNNFHDKLWLWQWKKLFDMYSKINIPLIDGVIYSKIYSVPCKNKNSTSISWALACHCQFIFKHSEIFLLCVFKLRLTLASKTHYIFMWKHLWCSPMLTNVIPYRHYTVTITLHAYDKLTLMPPWKTTNKILHIN